MMMTMMTIRIIIQKPTDTSTVRTENKIGDDTYDWDSREFLTSQFIFVATVDGLT
jgi:hypothetical protein